MNLKIFLHSHELFSDMQCGLLFTIRHGFKFYIVVEFADYIFWSSLLGFTCSFVGVMMWLLERATSLYTFSFNQRHFSQQDSGTLAPLSLVLTKTLAAWERIFWIVQRTHLYHFTTIIFQLLKSNNSGCLVLLCCQRAFPENTLSALSHATC